MTADGNPRSASGLGGFLSAEVAERTRFTWRTSADHRLVAVSAELGRRCGKPDPLAVGDLLPERLHALGIDPQARVAAALASNATWCRIALRWPVERGGFHMTLSGTPIFGTTRQLLGYCGFGTIDAETLEPISATRRAGDAPSNAAQLAPEAGHDVPSGRDDPHANSGGALGLSASEHNAFDEVARRLKADLQNESRATVLVSEASGEDETSELVASTVLQTHERKIEDLRAVLDIVTDGVVILDVGGRLLSINRSAEALFGRRESEVLGQRFITLLAPDSRAQALEDMDALERSGVAGVENDGREVVALSRGGGLIPVRMSLGRLPGGEVRTCVVLRDLRLWKRSESDLEEARRAAKRAERSKADFVACLSKDVRTPLEVIRSAADAVLQDRLLSDRHATALRDIQASGMLALQIVDGWRDLTAIETGRAAFEFTRVNANKVVADCLADVRSDADGRQVVLRLALAPHLPGIVADARSLRRIVGHLLANAIKFNTAGGQVIVSTALTDAGEAIVRIRDTGSGMSEAQVRAAHEPFWRAARDEEPISQGLGLALTRALAEANRAVFHITSKENEGTLAEVAFPAARVLSD